MKTVKITVGNVTIKGPLNKSYQQKNGSVKDSIFYVKTIEAQGTKQTFIEYQKHPDIDVNIGDEINIAYESITNEYGEENSIKKIKILKSTPEAPWTSESYNSSVGVTTRITKSLSINSTKNVNQFNEGQKTMSQNLKFFKIKGKLLYAHIKEIDSKGKFPTNKYKTDLIIDEQTGQSLSKLGVLIKERDGIEGKFVTLKSTFQPTIYDPDGYRILDIPLLGNGTEVLVTASLYDNKAPNGGKKCLGMNQVHIINLVQYDAPLLSDLDISE